MSETWSTRMLGVGDRLAGYEVESFVARGGMAVVYRARDLSLDRVVALKVIAPELAAHDKFRLRFMRESELAASIDHPNIIPIYAAGEADRLLYLVMRYVPGDDLGSVIKERGSLTPREALPLFTQVAGALDAAHARQLVHRDVKPGNILLSDDEDLAQRHVYLSDFGLTKRLSSLTGFTTTGHFLGTIQYVAPEQVANKSVDHRADIYSLGCVIYEALAGEPPFVREDDAALLWSHMTQEAPTLSSKRDDLPQALDPVLAKALSKDPEARPASCRALVFELRQAFRPTRPVAAPRSGPPVQSAKLPSPASPRSEPVAIPSRTTRVDRPADVPDSRDAAASHSRSGRRVRLVAGISAVALVAVFLTWFGINRIWGWQEYEGRADVTEAALTFEHPRNWTAHVHPGQFAVVAPSDLTKPFTPGGSWEDISQVAAADPDSLEGAFVESAGWLNLKSLDPLAGQVTRKFSASAKLQATEQHPTGAPEESQGVIGTMSALDGSAPPLYFEFVVLKTETRQGVLMLFCLESQKVAKAKTFQRVLKSVKLP